MSNQIPSFLSLSDPASAGVKAISGRRRLSFIDHTLKSVGKTIRVFYIHSESGNVSSVLSVIHPKIKVLVFVLMIVAISIANTIIAQLVSLLFIVALFFISGVKINYLYRKILILSFFFGFLIFAPAMLNVVSPGKIVFELFSLDKSYRFWIYTMTQTVGFTDEGINLVVLLFLRVFNSVSLSLIIVYSTSFSKLIHGFRVFFIPGMFLMILSLTYKFIVILSKTIEDTYLALKSRLFGSVKTKNIRALVSGRVLFIFRKAKSNYESTFDAMISRGYNGKIVLGKKNIIRMADIYFLVSSGIAATIIILI